MLDLRRQSKIKKWLLSTGPRERTRANFGSFLKDPCLRIFLGAQNRSNDHGTHKYDSLGSYGNGDVAHVRVGGLYLCVLA